MSETNDENGGSQSGDDGQDVGIGEEQLPEDLRATEDNPLARHPEQTGDPDDEIGHDSGDSGEEGAGGPDGPGGADAAPGQ